MNQKLIDALTDLIIRMDEAEVRLIDAAETAMPFERKRLESKANGVILARGYVREALTEARAGL